MYIFYSIYSTFHQLDYRSRSHFQQKQCCNTSLDITPRKICGGNLKSQRCLVHMIFLFKTGWFLCSSRHFFRGLDRCLLPVPQKKHGFFGRLPSQLYPHNFSRVSCIPWSFPHRFSGEFWNQQDKKQRCWHFITWMSHSFRHPKPPPHQNKKNIYIYIYTLRLLQFTTSSKKKKFFRFQKSNHQLFF